MTTPRSTQPESSPQEEPRPDRPVHDSKRKPSAGSAGVFSNSNPVHGRAGTDGSDVSQDEIGGPPLDTGKPSK